MTTLNWTCIGCGHVNYLDVQEQKVMLDGDPAKNIAPKFDPKYPARAEIIKCEKCKSQVSVQARKVQQ